MNDFFKKIIGVVIALLIVSTVAIPIIGSLEEASREVVVVEQASDTAFMREAKDGDVFEIVREVTADGTTDIMYLNGELLKRNNGYPRDEICVAGDNIYLRSVNPGNTSLAVFTYLNNNRSSTQFYGTITVGATLKLTTTFENGTVTCVKYDSTLPEDNKYSTVVDALPFAWCFVICNDNEASHYSSTLSDGTPRTAKVKDSSETIISTIQKNGEYYFVSYKDGNSLFASGTGTVDGTINFDYALLDGYTDVYLETVTCTITDGEETFTFNPHRIVVPTKIIGHVDKPTTISTLIGIVPLLLIVGVVLGVIAMFGRPERFGE